MNNVQRRLFGAFLAAAVGLLGLAAVAAVGPAPPTSHGAPGSKPTPSYKPGELLVKYKPELRLSAARLFQHGQRFAAITGWRHLDDIHQRYAVKEIRPLFTVPGKMDATGHARLEATRDEWQAHVEDIHLRFPVRARRAPVHQRRPRPVGGRQGGGVRPPRRSAGAHRPRRRLRCAAAVASTCAANVTARNTPALRPNNGSRTWSTQCMACRAIWTTPGRRTRRR